MHLVWLMPVFLSLVLMAAHLFRAGLPLLVALVLMTPLVLLVRRGWAARVVQVMLVAGAAEWFRTTAVLAMARESLGLPWTRLVVILGSVTLVTLCSALVFESASMRERYRGRRTCPGTGLEARGGGRPANPACRAPGVR